MASSGKSRITAARSARLASAETVARYSRHEDAQSAVNLLGERGFPVQALSIVGTDLRQVEHVVAPLSYPRVALAGAAQGLFFGILMGLLMLVFSGDSPLAAFGTAVPLGVALWMIMAVVGFNRNRDANYSAVGTTLAASYELVCDPREASEARRLLVDGPASEPVDRARGRVGAPTDERREENAPGGLHDSSRGRTDGSSHGPTAAGEPAGSREEHEASRSSRDLSADYQDLEDGRPRYGLREDDPTASGRRDSADEGRDAERQKARSEDTRIKNIRS